jgi:hypothetical protein
MTITLNHTIVPARDKMAAAQFFARIFGLHADPKDGHFAPIRINDTLTLLFDDDEEFESLRLPRQRCRVRCDLRPHPGGEPHVWQRRGASTTANSIIGTAAAASIFATLTAMCSNS